MRTNSQWHEQGDIKCATTGLTRRDYDERLKNTDAPAWAKEAAIFICRAYAITGWADPGYIANVITDEEYRARLTDREREQGEARP